MDSAHIVLVANRGEIARRVIRTVHAMGWSAVAVFSVPDADSPHVEEADRAVALDGATPAESYLDVDKLIAAGRSMGADMVHPGYGFISEQAGAAQAVLDAGMTWVGPAPPVIALLGDKIRAKAVMAAAGVPLLPGTSLEMSDGPEAWSRSAAGVGYPLLIKAAAGGGGRGMRIVSEPAQLEAAVVAASREAASSFGDGRVFCERLARRPRHIEVQVMADQHGNIVHLGERECSIQRRHQKIVEESPAPVLNPGLRKRMIEATLAGAQAVGYVGAGTWEFLVDGEDFYFLEVNTRLQVEHPVTECVTGLDLVRLQLEVAAGSMLAVNQADVEHRGHAIEVRLVAESPGDGWLPSSGPVHRFDIGDASQPVPGIRYDVGVRSGSMVSTHYDSLLGKIIAWAPTRREAAARLRRALGALVIHGPSTNQELLSRLLAEPDFLAGVTTTDYLDTHPELARSAGPPDGITELHLVAASVWTQYLRRATAPVLSGFPSRWRTLGVQPQAARWSHPAAGEVTVTYSVRGDSVEASVAVDGLVPGSPATGRIFRLDMTAVDLEWSGIRHRCLMHLAGTGGAVSVHVASWGGQSTLSEVPRFVDPAGRPDAVLGPAAPVPGTVVGIEVAAGDHVVAGQTLVVVEAMKLEHRIKAGADAVVTEVVVAVGDQVSAHQLLVVLGP